MPVDARTRLPLARERGVLAPCALAVHAWAHSLLARGREGRVRLLRRVRIRASRAKHRPDAAHPMRRAGPPRIREVSARRQVPRARSFHPVCHVPRTLAGKPVRFTERIPSEFRVLSNQFLYEPRTKSGCFPLDSRPAIRKLGCLPQFHVLPPNLANPAPIHSTEPPAHPTRAAPLHTYSDLVYFQIMVLPTFRLWFTLLSDCGVSEDAPEQPAAARQRAGLRVRRRAGRQRAATKRFRR